MQSTRIMYLKSNIFLELKSKYSNYLKCCQKNLKMRRSRTKLFETMSTFIPIIYLFTINTTI